MTSDEVLRCNLLGQKSNFTYVALVRRRLVSGSERVSRKRNSKKEEAFRITSVIQREESITTGKPTFFGGNKIFTSRYCSWDS